MKTKVKIISVATEDFHDYILSFLLSFQDKCKDLKDMVIFKIYLINYSDEKINDFDRIDLNIEKVLEDRSFKNKKSQSNFCTNYRYILLKENFNFEEVICWMDADTLFVQECHSIFSTLSNSKEYGIFLYKKPRIWKFKSKKYKTLMGGFIGISNNKEGELFSKNYFSRVGSYVHTHKNKNQEWWANQDVLRMMDKEQGQIYKPFYFEEPMFNTVLEKDTHLYFKDEKKRDHKPFLKISKHYVNKFKEK